MVAYRIDADSVSEFELDIKTLKHHYVIFGIENLGYYFETHGLVVVTDIELLRKNNTGMGEYISLIRDYKLKDILSK